MILKKNNLFIFFVGLLALGACSTNPQNIAYNEDQCHACKMIISNSHFGTEMVTKKGKVYKFDAIECLIPELLSKGESNYEHVLVTDYFNAHKLINAKTSSYLITKNLPSPMGGFLSAYENETNALNSKKQFGGEIFTWEEIVNKYSINLSDE